LTVERLEILIAKAAYQTQTLRGRGERNRNFVKITN
jgi:hypothetical protein